MQNKEPSYIHVLIKLVQTIQESIENIWIFGSSLCCRDLNMLNYAQQFSHNLMPNIFLFVFQSVYLHYLGWIYRPTQMPTKTITWLSVKPTHFLDHPNFFLVICRTQCRTKCFSFVNLVKCPIK